MKRICRDCLLFGAAFLTSHAWQQALLEGEALEKLERPCNPRPAKSTCKKLWDRRQIVGLPSGEVTHTYANHTACSDWKPALGSVRARLANIRKERSEMAPDNAVPLDDADCALLIDLAELATEAGLGNELADEHPRADMQEREPY